jgi:hypothetical protein
MTASNATLANRPSAVMPSERWVSPIEGRGAGVQRLAYEWSAERFMIHDHS